MRNEQNIKRILAIDGGGIKGVFPASFFANIEDSLGESVSKYFDLIVGTSTGGIIALALGIGMSGQEILKFYEKLGPEIFKGNRFVRFFRQIGLSKYSSKPLKNGLISIFGNKKLGESKKRVVVPSFNLETDGFDFSQYDLIIVATGNPTIELFLNEYFHNMENFPPIIFSWLEAYGIGGHALLTNNNHSAGCLECLYNQPADLANELYNCSSFAKENQYFAKSLSGCGNLFTPYSSLDSMQSAVLATKLALQALQNEELDNPILSWKGNGKAFFSAGYNVSDRYSLSDEKLFDLRYHYKE